MRWVAVCLAVATGGCAPTEPPTPSLAPGEHTPYSLTPAQLSTIKAATAKSLKDPESARFGQIGGTKQGGIVTVCGVVNAKNSFGGYTGIKPFIGIFDVTAPTVFVPVRFGGADFDTDFVARECLKVGITLA